MSKRVPNLAGSPGYAELHCLSSFSFLRGASQPAELAERAQALGYAALAITDECSVAGVVRAHTALAATLKSSASSSDEATRLIVGAEFRLACGTPLVVLARDRRGYADLCRLITRGRRAAPKGSYHLTRDDCVALLEPAHVFVLWTPRPADRTDDVAARATADWLRTHFATAAWIAVELLRDGTERAHLAALTKLARDSELPLVAAGAVCMHERARRRLHDALTAVRLGVPIAAAGLELLPSGERHLRERARLAKLYPRPLLEATLTIAAQCRFSLDELRYEYPRELVPAGRTAAEWLRELVERGAARRWSVLGQVAPHGQRDAMPAYVRTLVEHELALIAELGYEPYFLTVHDLVEFARRRGILCQGRGSAANSAVCYCLGITEVDPSRMSMLFERFISRERNEPPDIDVDFEHERREEVIQYVYQKYGRERAALAATVISYRPRSALRDLGKAFGLEADAVERLAKAVSHWDRDIDPLRLREAGFDPDAPRLRTLLELARQLQGFPRHLSQHVGGFVIARDSLEELVPVENASMAERTVIQWDKDDLDALGLLKVDLLALGMLTAIRRALALVSQWRVARGGAPLTLADVPPEDPRVYDMLCRADSVGVFQIESRAQMAMLPRLRPRNFYDLVIEVAIVRPGPIQGDMVHPYLRRRRGEEPVTYPSDAVKGVLQRTLGVPIFQEQVMQLAIVAAGFTPGEADQLRRAMAAWKRHGGLGHFGERLISGMAARGYDAEFAARIFEQIKGFGEYGFPESHAASFALLVYVSAWLKCHEPAAFCCALLNSQPMGFYSPSQLVRDAREHGVEVRPVDVLVSDVDCTLEATRDGRAALRLGLRMVRSLSAAAAQRIVAARASAFESVQQLAAVAALDRGDLEALAAAGACAALIGNRHRAFWEVAGTEISLPLAPPAPETAVPLLSRPTEGEDLVADYRSVGLTLGRHPLALLWPALARSSDELSSARELATHADGAPVRVAGIVVTRQKPSTASGVTFVTLEDHTGNVNLIVWKKIGEAQRRTLFGARLMEVEGRLQREQGVTHVIVTRLHDRTPLLGRLLTRSRDFR
ncbi:MAG: error-prone DNA polymerase [Gammaproteobacteria bacterium]|jgi:error-prone DNA polymerase|nr:error-prone DNA polymerase [Gammaproteobacteria bacterium]